MLSLWAMISNVQSLNDSRMVSWILASNKQINQLCKTNTFSSAPSLKFLQTSWAKLAAQLAKIGVGVAQTVQTKDLVTTNSIPQ